VNVYEQIELLDYEYVGPVYPLDYLETVWSPLFNSQRRCDLEAEYREELGTSTPWRNLDAERIRQLARLREEFDVARPFRSRQRFEQERGPGSDRH
jgi:hypothetical protein